MDENKIETFENKPQRKIWAFVKKWAPWAGIAGIILLVIINW